MSTLLTPPTKSVTPPPVRKSVRNTTPVPHRWTVEEYHSLEGNPSFTDLRSFLIDGVIYTMPQANPPHDMGLSKTQRWLFRVFDDRYYIRNQMGFGVGTFNDPGPDLAVIPGPMEAYEQRRPSTALFVIEIASSSIAIDTGRKAELYATAGVPDVFRDPQPGGTYASHRVLNEGEPVSPLAAPESTITAKDLLPAG
jgi:Uma2 family endonuclease